MAQHIRAGQLRARQCRSEQGRDGQHNIDPDPLPACLRDARNCRQQVGLILAMEKRGVAERVELFLHDHQSSVSIGQQPAMELESRRLAAAGRDSLHVEDITHLLLELVLQLRGGIVLVKE